MNSNTALVAIVVAVLAFGAFMAYQEDQLNRAYIDKGYCRTMVNGMAEWRPCPGPAWEALPKVGESR